MGVMLQIKDAPPGVHRVLKARAALEGVSLTEYARACSSRQLAGPPREELIAELSPIEPVETGESAADALAHVRGDPV